MWKWHSWDLLASVFRKLSELAATVLTATSEWRGRAGGCVRIAGRKARTYLPGWHGELISSLIFQSLEGGAGVMEVVTANLPLCSAAGNPEVRPVLPYGNAISISILGSPNSPTVLLYRAGSSATVTGFSCFDVRGAGRFTS